MIVWNRERKAAWRIVLSALLILCLVLGAAGCGKSKESGGEEKAGQQDGQIVYAGDGRFAVSGFSSEYDSTAVEVILDDKDPEDVGGAFTKGLSYLVVGTNVQDAVAEETNGYQKLVIRIYGSPDLSTDERSEDSIEKTFYIKCAGTERFDVTAIIGTDEKASPPDWEWE